MTQSLVYRRKRFFSLALFFSLFFIMQNIFAFDVKPSILELSSSGKSTRQTLRLINNSAQPIPIEILVSKIDVNREGDVLEKTAGEEFLIFPPQTMVAAGATQNFKIQWVGNPDIKKSQSYIFSVNQIPVKEHATGEKKVEIVFNYKIAVNVRPMDGSSELILVKTEIGKDKKGILRPILTVKNSKNIHARLSDAVINLSSGEWSKNLSAVYLRQHIGVGLIQPGKTRRVMLNIDIPLTLTDLKATINYKSW